MPRIEEVRGLVNGKVGFCLLIVLSLGRKTGYPAKRSVNRQVDDKRTLRTCGTASE